MGTLAHTIKPTVCAPMRLVSNYFEYVIIIIIIIITPLRQ